MNDKRSMLIIAVGFAAVLCISLLIALHSENNDMGETIVVVNSAPASSSENGETVSDNTYVTEEMPKTTEAVKETIATAQTEAYSEISEEPLWINLNTADAEELMKLNGIGEVTAAKIIEYRETYGGFRNIEEIMNVDGIGEKKFEAIFDCIYVEDPIYEDEFSVEEVIPEEEPTDLPYEEETAAASVSAVETDTTEHKPTLEEIAPININTADAEELMLLPYVTEEIAERIIELREGIGGYSHPYELLYIEELEQKQVAEIIEFVTVGQ